MERCIHGMDDKSWCGICRGDDRKQIEARKGIKKLTAKQETRIKYKQLALLSKETARRHKEEFTKDELRLVIENTVDKKKDLDIMYQLAYTVERTMNSIDWIIKCAWDKKYNAIGKMERAYYMIEDIKLELGYL